MLLLLAAATVPQWFTALAPDAVDTDAILLPPGPAHWFGTDQLGRDVFTRVVYGTSQSLGIGIGATLIGCAGGVVLGTAAGLAPPALQRLLVRLIDILLAFPEILLALLIIAVLGRGPTNTLLAVGLSSIAGYARLVRSQVLRVWQSGYVEHAVSLGKSTPAIIARHVVPNAVRPLVVLATIGVGNAVLSASALSFIGLGVVPPAANGRPSGRRAQLPGYRALDQLFARDRRCGLGHRDHDPRAAPTAPALTWKRAMNVQFVGRQDLTLAVPPVPVTPSSKSRICTSRF